MTNTDQVLKKEVPINLALAIVFNTEKKKILVVKRKKEAQISGLTWCFPGGKIDYEDDLENKLKSKIKEKLGLRVESLGSIFAETHARNGRKLFSVYFLCEFIDGKEKISEDFEDIKWISPREVGKYFQFEIHPVLKEYLKDLE